MKRKTKSLVTVVLALLSALALQAQVNGKIVFEREAASGQWIPMEPIKPRSGTSSLPTSVPATTSTQSGRLTARRSRSPATSTLLFPPISMS